MQATVQANSKNGARLCGQAPCCCDLLEERSQLAAIDGIAVSNVRIRKVSDFIARIDSYDNVVVLSNGFDYRLRVCRDEHVLDCLGNNHGSDVLASFGCVDCVRHGDAALTFAFKVASLDGCGLHVGEVCDVALEVVVGVDFNFGLFLRKIALCLRGHCVSVSENVAERKRLLCHSSCASNLSCRRQFCECRNSETIVGCMCDR